MPQTLHRSFQRLGAFLALALFAMSASPTLAATLCCKCRSTASPNTTLCLTSQTITSCGNILASSGNTANLTGISCDSSALDTNSTCQQSAQNGPGVCGQTPSDATTYTSSTSAGTATAIIPKLNVDIPGVIFSQNISEKEKTITLPFLAQYLAGVYRYLISISVIAAAVMIVYGGFKYILGSSFASINSGKNTITDAIIGLMLIFGTYTILYILNPATLTLTAVTIPVIQPSIYTVPEGTFQTLQQKAVAQGYTPDPEISKALKSATGGTQPSSRMFPNNPFDSRTTLPADQLDNILTTIGQKYSIDVCILKAIVATESGRRANAIGHDEDAAIVTIQSRLDFLRSGKKYSGETFTPPAGLPSDVTKANLTEATAAVKASAGIKNDDSLNEKPPDYGLDWRFSHGFGAGQCTIFPKGSGTCKGPDGDYGLSRGGKCFTVPILMTWEGQLDCMAQLLKGQSSNTPCKIFQNYSGDQKDTSCTGELLAKKMAAYNSCKGT